MRVSGVRSARMPDMAIPLFLTLVVLPHILIDLEHGFSLLRYLEFL